MILVDIAEAGIFNKPNEAPIEAAKKVNLYEALNYLNTKKAITLNE